MRAPGSFLTTALCGFGVGISAIAQSPAPPPLLARPPEPPVAKITVTGEERWKLAVSHPTPEYPPEARHRHLSGAGVYELRVEDSGEVSGVTVIRSTGQPILDHAAIKTLKQWRFRPHTTLARVKVPITFNFPSTTTRSKQKT